MVRSQLNFNRLTLTDITVDIKRVPKKKTLIAAMEADGLSPEIPEDLYRLIKKAFAFRKHLERNRKDKDSKFRLILYWVWKTFCSRGK